MAKKKKEFVENGLKDIVADVKKPAKETTIENQEAVVSDTPGHATRAYRG